MLTIDGSRGEGGGQILRTSLGLSLLTGIPFRIERIRAGRPKPGLRRQHLTAVNAAARIGSATVAGAAPGSRDLEFRPGEARPGEHFFAVGTAGSAALVLQTVLPALLSARAPSTLTIEGGTHNPFAPPFDFLARAFLPLVERMGPRITARLERFGFFPAGGGRISVRIEPAPRLERIDLLERGAVRRRLARAIVANLPLSIAERELRVVAGGLGWGSECLESAGVEASAGPGNALAIEIEGECVTEVFTGIGERGVSAERVAQGAVEDAREYLAADVPVGRHLADQLLLPMAIAGGGSFRTLPLSLHAATNIEVIRRFLDVRFTVREDAGGAFIVEVGG